MIPHLNCRAVQHVVFDSGAADMFETALRPSKRGRPAGFRYGLFLAGMLLAGMKYSQTHLSRMHTVLTEEVPLLWQYKWGIRTQRTNDDGSITTWVLGIHDLENVSTALRNRLNYAPQFLPDLDGPGHAQQERDRRKGLLQEIVDKMIGATLIDRPAGSRDYAMDATGIWASERARAATADTQSGARRPGRRRASDAAWGSKTHKDGNTVSFFGYEMHALARVPTDKPVRGMQAEPSLLVGIRVTPASEDVVAPSLELIATALAQGTQIQRLMVDRHYSYKKFDRWALPLVERDIVQVLDLHEADQGFYDWDQALIAAGWVHCPFTPTHLGTIPNPGPTATPQARATFRERIAQREQYAARLSKPMDTNGTTRWECPALVGKLGCPRRPGTVEVAAELGLPIVPAPLPADGEHLPALCSQGSISLTPVTDEQRTRMKSHQRYYFGSDKQLQQYGRRTYVEGCFGTFKGDTAANKKRGSSLHTGLARVTLELATFAVIVNIIHLRSWHKRTQLGDPHHPILDTGQPETHDPVILISHAEYAAFLAHQQQQPEEREEAA